jgi:flavorubredoxin
MEDMTTQVDEIAAGIYRLSTYTEAVPGGFTFNQFLVAGEEPLLFHTGLRHLFPSVSAALAKVVPLERLRWVSFGHWEADESGALNLWLEAATRAELAVGALGVMISGGDQADRPPRAPLTDGEVLDLGGKRMRWIDTPHVPHGWDAGVWYEETTNTLLCGDLLTAAGPATALIEGDIVGPALATEDMFGATCLTPLTAPTIHRLAELAPTTLGIMHGPSYSGDGATALQALADYYEARLQKALGGSRP